jgi:hypothetical protein
MTMRKLILICLLPLAACTSAALRKSSDFQAGYSDGCASASLEGANKRESSFTRDDSAYQSNKAYHAGWGSGFGACRQMDAPQNSDPLALHTAP